MAQAKPKRRTAIEDDPELRSLTAVLLEEEQLDTIECESAEAALAVLLIGGPDTPNVSSVAAIARGSRTSAKIMAIRLVSASSDPGERNPITGHHRLLRARRERPRDGCAAEQRDELAPSHVWMAPAWQEKM